MGRFIVLCFITSLLTPVVFAEERVYLLTVSGEAVTLAVPDEAVISLSIQTGRHRTKQEAAHRLDTAAGELMAYLKNAGVPERTITSLNRWVQPAYDYDNGKRRPIGHQGSQFFRVIVSLDTASDILDDLPESADENGISYRVSNEREIRDETVDHAIDDASARAARRARTLGITLGPVVGFSESNLGPSRGDTAPRAVRMMADESTPQVPAGENELRVSVTITYRIELPE